MEGLFNSIMGYLEIPMVLTFVWIPVERGEGTGYIFIMLLPIFK